jgi:ABC-type branched-subunit amino acid transport system substrate-binding protein
LCAHFRFLSEYLFRWSIFFEVSWHILEGNCDTENFLFSSSFLAFQLPAGESRLMPPDRMKRKMLVVSVSAFVLLFATDFSHAASTNGLSPAELRGRTIYRKGESPSARPIMTVVGGTEIEAKLVPCGSCHGMDGRGRPEGSVVPPSIRWEGLISPHRVAADGRERAPYNEHLLVRAMTMGFDSQGSRLNTAMPRYALSRSDADDLIAYLKKLSTDYDPGISDDAVRIGVLLPPASKYPGLPSAMRNVLTAYFAGLNKGGGLYGRRIELLCRELPPETEKAASAFREFAEKEQPFALVASFIAGSEKQSTTVLEEQKVPLVGAWTLLPEARSSPSSPVFYLDSGLPGQSEALSAFALREYAGADSKLEIVVSDDELSHAAATAARSKLQGSQWAAAEEVNGPADSSGADALVQRLAAAQVKVLFLALREPQLALLLNAIQRSRWNPILLIPSALSADAGGLQPFSGRAFLAVSSLPSDVTPDALTEYQKLASEYGLSRQHLAAQYAALAAAKILTEGLKRAGRDLARERLLESLEAIYAFPTGFSPPVSFGPARHIGITQFHIMTVDTATGGLIEINRARR